MSPLAFLIFAPILAAPIVGLVNRWSKVASGLGTLAVFIFWFRLKTIALPPASGQLTAVLWGQPLSFNEGIRSILLFIYAGVILLFLLAIPFPQGRKFVPGSLAVLGLLAAALLLRPFAYGVIALWMAFSLAAVIIQEEQAGQTRASLTYILLMSIAVPLLLLAVWLVETQPTTLVTPVARLALIGFVILLAGFPFHVWVTAVIRRAPPLAVVFLLGLVQLVSVTFALSFLQASPWLQRDPQFVQTAHLSGLAVLLTAGFMAVTAVRWQRLLGSLVLLNMGLVLLTLPLPGALSWETAVSLQITQFAALLLTAVGHLLLRRQRQNENIALADSPTETGNPGLGRQAPFTISLYLLAGLALLGLPLSFGFGSHWLALQALGSSAAPWISLFVLLALGAAAFALFRAGLYWLEPAAEPETAVAGEPRWLQAILGILILAVLWLSLHPAILLNYSAQLASLF